MKKLIDGHKVLFIVLAIIIGIILIINMLWFVAVKKDYLHWANIVGETENSLGDLVNATQEGDYTFGVKQPSYLHWNGFLSVGKQSTSTVTIDKDGKEHGNGTDITMYIWPKLFGEIKYGFMIIDHDKKTTDYGYTKEDRTINEQIYVDENMNFIPYDQNNIEYNQYIENLLEDNKAECLKMMNMAKEKWEIN